MRRLIDWILGRPNIEHFDQDRSAWEPVPQVGNDTDWGHWLEQEDPAGAANGGRRAHPPATGHLSRLPALEARGLQALDDASAVASAVPAEVGMGPKAGKESPPEKETSSAPKTPQDDAGLVSGAAPLLRASRDPSVPQILSGSEHAEPILPSDSRPPKCADGGPRAMNSSATSVTPAPATSRPRPRIHTQPPGQDRWRDVLCTVGEHLTEEELLIIRRQLPQ